MRALLAALALVPLALLARQQGVAATTACHSTLSSGAHTVQIMVGSVQRSALVHVPARLPAGARVPVLIALHGWGGSGPRMETYSGFSKLADRHGFLAAYPSSSGTHWNYKAIRGGPDDVGFLRSLILPAAARVCGSTTRVRGRSLQRGRHGRACRLSPGVADRCDRAGRRRLRRAARVYAVAPAVGAGDPRNRRSRSAVLRTWRASDPRRRTAVRERLGGARWLLWQQLEPQSPRARS